MIIKKVLELIIVFTHLLGYLYIFFRNCKAFIEVLLCLLLENMNEGVLVVIVVVELTN
jgi:hypothetical protein